MGMPLNRLINALVLVTVALAANAGGALAFHAGSPALLGGAPRGFPRREALPRGVCHTGGHRASAISDGASGSGGEHTGRLDRRAAAIAAPEVLLKSAAALGLFVLGSKEVLGAPVQGPVCVIGAGGGTGKACVDYLISSGLPVKTLVRAKVTSKGEEVVFEGKGTDILEVVADVTSPTSMMESIAGSRAVIFAASASKKGGDPQAVDYQGLLNVADACIANKVERLVVVSSGGVSRPDSAVYKFLNLFGKIMFWKIKGEDEMRAKYATAKQADPSLKISYTVVRPGGLTKDQPLGVSAIELNQMDTKSGRIARSDVARICVECLKSKAAEDTTFECYYADTAKPLNDVGVSNIFKKTTSAEEAASSATGLERRGSTWDELFTGLRKD